MNKKLLFVVIFITVPCLAFAQEWLGQTTAPEPVDLGLSVLWGSTNVGRGNYETLSKGVSVNTGLCYAWGETEPKGKYNSDFYTLKENGQMMDISDISGTKYDVARKHLGGKWRMPTKAEVEELMRECTYIYDKKMKGYIFTGPNGKSIFIFCSGFINGINDSDASLGGYGKNVVLWTSTQGSSSNSAYALILKTWPKKYKFEGLYMEGKSCGLFVRPVMDR